MHMLDMLVEMITLVGKAGIRLVRVKFLCIDADTGKKTSTRNYDMVAAAEEIAERLKMYPAFKNYCLFIFNNVSRLEREHARPPQPSGVRHSCNEPAGHRIHR